MTTGLLLFICKDRNSYPSITLRESTVTGHRCSCCNSLIYSRRFPTCRECGAELPPEVMLNRRAAAKLGEEVATSRTRIRNFAESPVRSPGLIRLRF